MMNNKNLIAIAVAGFLLQSCNVTKSVQKEADLNVESIPSTYILTKDTTAYAVVSYQKFFGNDELKSFIAKVIENNNDLQASTEVLMASEALLKSTKLNYLPDVNLQVSPSVQRLSKNSMMGGFASDLVYQDYNVAPSLSWEIDLWGKLKGQRKEAIALFLAEKETVRALKIELISQTASTYYNLLFLQSQLKEIGSIKELMTNSVSLLESQYQYGDATSIAMKQANDQVFEMDLLMNELKQNIKNQEIYLSSLQGLYPNSYDFKSELKDYTFGFSQHSSLPLAQLENRPDIKAVELQLQAANERVGINKAAFYPSVSLSAQMGLNSVTAGNLFQIPASLFGNLAGNLTQPLFNKRANKSNYEASVYQREAKIAQFKQIVITGVGEVTDAFNNLEYLSRQKSMVNDKMNNLDQSIDDAQKLYQFGEITYLEVLAVQQIYLQSKIAYLEVIHQDINAHIQAYKAIGGE